MDRENFYVLLGLSIDPVVVDKKTIEVAIESKTVEWSRLTNHPAKRTYAKQCLELLGQIKQVMLENDIARENEAKEAQKLISAKQKALFEEVDQAIWILSAKGHIKESEIGELAKTYSLDESVIHKRVKCKILKSSPESSELTKPLDQAIEQQISNALGIVKKKDLYDFLDLSPTSSITTLLNKAKERYSEFHKNSNKTAEVTAGENLAVQCMSRFEEEDKRRQYDVTRSLANLRIMDRWLHVAGAEKTLEPPIVDALVKQAASHGIKAANAFQYIKDYCSKRRWLMKVPSKLSYEEMKQCGPCGVYNPPDAKNCSECGVPLELICPKCSNRTSSSNIACPNCGFSIGDMPNALRLVKEGKIALAKGDFQMASQLFSKVEVYWPGNPKAIKAQEEIDRHRQSVSVLVGEIDSALKKKYLYKVRKALGQLRLLDKEHPALKDEQIVDKRIDVAEGYVRKALAAKDEDRIIDAFQNAINEVADCREAIDGMSRLPPRVPNNLKLGITSRSIALSWTKSPSKGDIAYRVLRKEDTPPSSSEDGKLLSETKQTVFNDVTGEPGQTYYYAVYSVRGTACSQRGLLSEPVLRSADVEDIQIKLGNGCIQLKWKAPRLAYSIEVWRKEGKQPDRPGDGIQLRGVSQSDVTDSNIKPGLIYYYRVIAVYHDRDNSSQKSNGICCEMKCSTPPPPVMDLKCARTGDSLLFSWTPPSDGFVELILSKEGFSLSPGETFSKTHLTRLGRRLKESGRGKARYKVDFQGVIQTIPVTIKDDMAVAGASRSFTSINDVSKLGFQISSGCLYLEWDWPSGSQMALVAYRHDTYPISPEDKLAASKQVSKSEYERSSAFVISKMEDKPYYFVVYIVADVGKEIIFSLGERIEVIPHGRAKILYRIKIDRNIFRKPRSIELLLASEEETISIPKLVLVSKSGNIPIKIKDGTPILNISKGLILGPTPRAFEISLNLLQPDTYVSLFVAEPEQSTHYHLSKPRRDDLRLF